MKRVGIPRYIKIALDLARKIMNLELKPGELIKGRTILASEYSASPETIRKATALLDEQGVVEVRQGVGIFVSDIIKAENFVAAYKSDKSVRQQQDELESLFRQKEELDQKIMVSLKDVVESFKYRTTEAIKFYEIEVIEGCIFNGKTIAEMQFYQKTGATVVAIIHDDYITVSPGPKAEVLIGDILVVVGDEDVVSRVEKYLDEGQPWQQ